MKSSARDWHETALTRLINVLGEDAGRAIAASVLADIGVSKLSSASDLRRFGEALSARGGFASAVGALLSLHATIHDDTRA